jgi:hypothetical protein
MIRHQHGRSDVSGMLFNPFCPITAAKVLTLKATVILLLTMLIKAKIWASPDFVDTDQGFTGVSVRAAMNACS